MTSLQQLNTMTTIVADTGDLAAIARLKPVDATTNPSLITKALNHPDKHTLLKETLAQHHNDIDAVIDALTVQIGCDILQLIAGRVSTEVDARLSYDTQATIAKAHEFITAYQQAGIEAQRVLIKIAATWQGIEAAKVLEREGIHCNLTLLFGMHQAQACADAGVTLISPFVGRILDWQKRHENREQIAISEDLGVQSVTAIYHYYKQHDYATQVMGASFRSTEQVLALAGCDLLTVAPDLLDQLDAQNTPVPRQLSADAAKQAPHTPQIHHEADSFERAYQQDQVTQELLPKGIDGFIAAREELAEALRQLL